jgi:hypothetical protein
MCLGELARQWHCGLVPILSPCPSMSLTSSNSPTCHLPLPSIGCASRRSRRGRGDQYPLALCKSKNSCCVPVFWLFAMSWGSCSINKRSRGASFGDLQFVLIGVFFIDFDLVRFGVYPLINSLSPAWFS